MKEIVKKRRQVTTNAMKGTRREGKARQGRARHARGEEKGRQYKATTVAVAAAAGATSGTGRRSIYETQQLDTVLTRQNRARYYSAYREQRARCSLVKGRDTAAGNGALLPPDDAYVAPRRSQAVRSQGGWQRVVCHERRIEKRKTSCCLYGAEREELCA